jgi:hypothetical protein
MKTARRVVGSLVMSLGIASSFTALADGPPPHDSPGTCIKVRPEARYLGLGYNHIVHVADVCASAAECDVSTDVNPTPQHLSVPAGSEVEVNTFLGSPARVFVPKVVCTMR